MLPAGTAGPAATRLLAALVAVVPALEPTLSVPVIVVVSELGGVAPAGEEVVRVAVHVPPGAMFVQLLLTVEPLKLALGVAGVSADVNVIFALAQPAVSALVTVIV